MKKSMQTRILLGGLMLLGLVGLMWGDWALEEHTDQAPGLLMAVVLLAIAIAGFGEVARLAGACGVRVLGMTGLAATALLATLPYWRQWLDGEMASGFFVSAPLVLLGLASLAIFIEQMARFKIEDAIRQLSATALAVLYVGVGLALLLTVRIDFGLPVLVLLLAAVKFTDIGAYFTGSAIGRHKLIPWLSPGKSWEGLIGGMLTAAGISVLATWALRIDVLGPSICDGATLTKTLLFGGIIGAAGQLADLCESLLKRSAGVKDSGNIVPEFGGVLDIIDSPLLAAPIAVVLLNVLR